MKVRKDIATYSLGDMLPLELCAGADTGRCLGSGWIHPKRLLDASHEVRQAGGGFHVNLRLALEGASDLVDHGFVHVAVFLQPDVEGEPGHGRSRRFTAGRHDRGRVHEDIKIVEAGLPIARLLEHVRHEVPAAAGALAQRLAGHGLLIGEAAVVDLHLKVLC